MDHCFDPFFVWILHYYFKLGYRQSNKVVMFLAGCLSLLLGELLFQACYFLPYLCKALRQCPWKEKRKLLRQCPSKVRIDTFKDLRRTMLTLSTLYVHLYLRYRIEYWLTNYRYSSLVKQWMNKLIKLLNNFLTAMSKSTHV